MYQSIPAVPIPPPPGQPPPPDHPPPPRTTPVLRLFLLILGTQYCQYRVVQGWQLGTFDLLCIVGKYIFNLTAVSPTATWRTQKEKLYTVLKNLQALNELL